RRGRAVDRIGRGPVRDRERVRDLRYRGAGSAGVVLVDRERDGMRERGTRGRHAVAPVPGPGLACPGAHDDVDVLQQLVWIRRRERGVVPELGRGRRLEADARDVAGSVPGMLSNTTPELGPVAPAGAASAPTATTAPSARLTFVSRGKDFPIRAP